MNFFEESYKRTLRAATAAMLALTLVASFGIAALTFQGCGSSSDTIADGNDSSAEDTATGDNDSSAEDTDAGDNDSSAEATAAGDNMPADEAAEEETSQNDSEPTVFTEYIDLFGEDCQNMDGYEDTVLYTANMSGVYTEDEEDDYDSDDDLYSLRRLEKDVDLDGVTWTVNMTYLHVENEELFGEDYEGSELQSENDRVSSVYFILSYMDPDGETMDQDDILSFLTDVYGEYDSCFSAEKAQELGLSLENYEENLEYVSYQWNAIEGDTFAAELTFYEDCAQLDFYPADATGDPLEVVDRINSADSVASVMEYIFDFCGAELLNDVDNDLVQAVEDYGDHFTISIQTGSMLQFPYGETQIYTDDLSISTTGVSLFINDPVYVLKAEIRLTVNSETESHDGYVMIVWADNDWRILFLDSDGKQDWLRKYILN